MTPAVVPQPGDLFRFNPDGRTELITESGHYDPTFHPQNTLFVCLEVERIIQLVSIRGHPPHSLWELRVLTPTGEPARLYGYHTTNSRTSPFTIVTAR